ncbi:MAG: lipocalin family protein [Prevotella sp.]|nr:lipocalin family protein [Prevotella sp.]
MRIKSVMLIIAAAVLAASCGHSEDPGRLTRSGHSNDELKLKDDKTVYGLACEGCTDSVVVLLPNDGSDPVRYNIIEATRQRQIMGKIKVGDWIGVVLNPQDGKKADIVIDLDELKGIWCYIVMPKMRDYATMSPRLQKRMMQAMPDSLKQLYMIPREYGFWMKRHWTAQSVGYVPEASSLEDESPVVYPQLSFFTEWHILNGQLVMTSGQVHMKGGNGNYEVTNLRYDTCKIEYLQDDSLVLSSDGIIRSYYRKANISDVNRKAKAIAAKRSQEALRQAKE